MIPVIYLTLSHFQDSLGHFGTLYESIIYNLIINAANYFGLMFNPKPFFIGKSGKAVPSRAGDDYEP